MKKLNIMTKLVFTLFFMVSCGVSVQCLAQEEPKKYEVKIKGLEKIDDVKFRKDLLGFIDSQEHYNFKKEAEHYSKKYIKEHTSDMQDAQYSKSGLGESIYNGLKYDRITGYNKKSENRLSIDVTYLINSQGNTYKTGNRFYFVLENGLWRFDGPDPKYFKQQEVQE